MSILSSLILELRELFFPARCAVCGEPLGEEEQLICTLCRVTAPLTGYESEPYNPLMTKFEGLVPIERGAVMLYFRQESGWQRMIHDFKYRSAWRTAREMGRWYGRRLAESGWYEDVDLIIPMPLHPLKQLQRGYNQASYLAEGMGLSMGVKVERRAVRRARYTSSQAQTPMRQRASNVEDAFAVRRAELLREKHLLIVDDVLTTGSTVAALCSAILGVVPDCRISVAVLAASRASLGVE